jgi:hypothetical protein
MTPRGATTGLGNINSPGAFSRLYASAGPSVVNPSLFSAFGRGPSAMQVPGSGLMSRVANTRVPNLGMGGPTRAAVLSATGASSLPRVIPAANTPGGNALSRFASGTKYGRIAKGVGLPMAINAAIGFAQDPVVDALGGPGSNAGQIADAAMGGARIGSFAGPVGAGLGFLGAGIGQAVTEGMFRGDDDRGSLPQILANTDNGVAQFIGQMAGGRTETGLPASMFTEERASVIANDPVAFSDQLTTLGVSRDAAAEMVDEYESEVYRFRMLRDADPQGFATMMGAPEGTQFTDEDIRRSMYSSILQSIPEVVAAEEAEQEQLAYAAAMQMAAAEFMEPYTQGAYDRANAQRAMLEQMIPTMPAEVQGIARTYGEQMAGSQEALADVYAANTRMIPYLGVMDAFNQQQAALAQQQQAPAGDADQAALLAMLQG